MKVSYANNYLWFFFGVTLMISCTEEKSRKELPFGSKVAYQRKMIESHQVFLRKEKQRIQQYIDSTGLNFLQSGTGLRSYIYHKTSGDSLKAGEVAIITYVLKSLKGDTLYISPKGRVQEFLVDFDNLERGLHEGIKQMKVGEKGTFILPAHLAHGITGDQAAISSQETIVYDVYLVGKR